MAARCFRALVAKASLEVEVSDYEESSGSSHEAMAPHAAKGTDAARYQRRVGCVPNVALCCALGDRGFFPRRAYRNFQATRSFHRSRRAPGKAPSDSSPSCRSSCSTAASRGGSGVAAHHRTIRTRSGSTATIKFAKSCSDRPYFEDVQYCLRVISIDGTKLSLIDECVSPTTAFRIEG